MPYRRLPNTDAARIRALKAALKKGDSLDDINQIAYSFPLKQKIDIFLPKFEIAITTSKAAREKQQSKVHGTNKKSPSLYFTFYSGTEFYNSQRRTETPCPYFLRSR